MYFRYRGAVEALLFEGPRCVFPIRLIAVLLFLGIPAITQALDPFALGSFTKTATYSVAVQHKLFDRQNLNVTYLQVPNSTYAYAALLNGTYDVLFGALDNALNRRWNSGQPLSVLAQLDLGSDFVLQSVPSITSISQLKGKPLMVDSPVSGYAYALQRILSLHGLNLADGDYSFQVVGGGNLRYAALLNGTFNNTPVYATMMTAPFTAYGRALNATIRPNILARASDYLQPYSSYTVTATTTGTSISSTRNKIVRFLAAMLEANRFLSNPKNMNSSVSAIAATLNISNTLAKAEYDVAVDALTGETSPLQGGNFSLTTQGVWNVISARQQFGGWHGNVSSGFDFSDALVSRKDGIVDLSLRDEALGLLGKADC